MSVPKVSFKGSSISINISDDVQSLSTRALTTFDLLTCLICVTPRPSELRLKGMVRVGARLGTTMPDRSGSDGRLSHLWAQWSPVVLTLSFSWTFVLMDAFVQLVQVEGLPTGEIVFIRLVGQNGAVSSCIGLG